MDLRRVLTATGAIVVPAPEVLVAQADKKRDASGAFTDEATRKYLARLLEELQRWSARFASVLP